MELLSLTYTSKAAAGLTPADVDAIHRAATTYNPLDGVTGILLYNGQGFMQMIEGAETAIDDLLARLMKDRRHHSIEVRDRHVITERFFPHWSMHLLDIPQSYEEGMRVVRSQLDDTLKAEIDPIVDQSVAAISKLTPDA